MTDYVQTDGGRMASKRLHLPSSTDDACRAVSIALELPYWEVYQDLKKFCNEHEHKTRGRRTKSHPSTGIIKSTLQKFLAERGWEWVPTKEFGKLPTMCLNRDDLPPGRIIVRLLGHFCAVVDGVIHDTHDPSRDGTRHVYGYWSKK